MVLQESPQFPMLERPSNHETNLEKVYCSLNGKQSPYETKFPKKRGTQVNYVHVCIPRNRFPKKGPRLRTSLELIKISRQVHLMCPLRTSSELLNIFERNPQVSQFHGFVYLPKIDQNFKNNPFTAPSFCSCPELVIISKKKKNEFRPVPGKLRKHVLLR